MTIGIYKITNRINGKSYIGQSINIESRIQSHFQETKIISPLYSSIKKHGKDNFEWCILIECLVEELDSFEVLMIKEFDTLFSNGNGYNQTDGGKQYRFDDSIKEKISQKTKEKMDVFVKDRISHSLVEKWKDVNYRGKLSGKFKSDYMKGIFIGRELSAETKEKISNSLKSFYQENGAPTGFKHSEESKKRMSVSAKKRFECPDQREKNQQMVKQLMDTRPEIKEKISNSVKRTFGTDNYQAKVAQKRKDRYEFLGITKSQIIEMILGSKTLTEAVVKSKLTTKVFSNLCKFYFNQPFNKKLKEKLQEESYVFKSSNLWKCKSSI